MSEFPVATGRLRFQKREGKRSETERDCTVRKKVIRKAISMVFGVKKRDPE